MRDGEYLLGMEPEEVRRLEQQHRAWRAETERVWELAGFGVGQTLIDLGSGPGFTTLDLAQRVGPSGRVVAVDSSERALEQVRMGARKAGLQSVETVRADVTELDVAPWQPDGVFARWLFSFLPQPAEVVQKLASGLRAGTTVAVIDYWNYPAMRTEPAAPLFHKVFRAVFDSYSDAGGSLEVAGALPGVFVRAGLRVTDVEPLCQVGRPGTPAWEWVSAFQDLYLPQLVAKGYLSADELAEYQAWWRALSEMPGALLFCPPLLGVIGVKE